MKPESAWISASGMFVSKSYTEKAAQVASADLEVGRLVAYYVDCRALGIPIDIANAVEGASTLEIAEEAASLMLTAGMLLDAQ